MNIKESPIAILTRRRTILAYKITQERHSLTSGGMMASPPAGYKYVPGQTRHQQLANWEQMLVDIDGELTKAILN
jgi:hypothetical protein